MSNRRLTNNWWFWLAVVLVPVLIILAIGIPVGPTPSPHITDRCYFLGKWNEFLFCYEHSGIVLRGTQLINHVVNAMNWFLNPLGYVTILLFIATFITGPFLLHTISKNSHED